MAKNPRWTQEEIEYLTENYSKIGTAKCAGYLDRSIEAIRIKASKLGLKCDIDNRYNRISTPVGYEYCYICKQILPDSNFYKKNKYGKYGKKANGCRSCVRNKARRDYQKHKSSAREKYRKNPEKRMYQNIKGRAKKNNIDFNIQQSDIIIPKICPVLGIKIIPFSNSDNSPSVDRLDPKSGYVKDNIAIISKKANRIKNDANSDEIYKVYTWLKSKGY